MSSLPPRPSRRLDNKVAIVTGAGSSGEYGLGNGRAIAILLAEDGATVLCADVDLATAERTAELVREEGGKAVALAADVSSEADCERLVREAEGRFGRLDVLVNNVGVMGAKGTAAEASAREWAVGWEVNVTSMMVMAKYAIPLMLRNRPGDGGVKGSIVNMGSIAGLLGGARDLFYPTSKGAVVNMTKAMAANHGHQGIRVNSVCPGFLYTPMASASGMSDEIRDQRRNQSLLKTEGNAWDCAAAVRFLASDEARWITGTNITVDAGATAAYVMPEWKGL